MSEEQRDGRAGQGKEEDVKVVDRRRFRPDGAPIEDTPAAEAPAEESAAAAPPAPDERDATIAKQAARIDELTRAYASLVDDNRAFRGRMEREKERVLDSERGNVAQALLDAADELERALGAAGSAGPEESGSPLWQTLLEGVRLAHGLIVKRIGELGATRIPVTGQRFDPRVAEAVDTVSVGDESQDDVVLQEIRSGWRIGDRVLRPARVRVGRLARA
jgi:molecular chaperone GrpE